MPDRYRVAVVGTCDHQWPGTVTVTSPLVRDALGNRFTLDRDDATCPECGANATTALFGLNPDPAAGGAPPATARPPGSQV
jgi:hypothetical protein